ncbi:class I SAM-dependent methyltransferase [Dethiosulfatarculus sandiegensis]|uniref:Methyltransferase type 11 domain-containing protein n=1 Tax=Dethiosulfatarculus sandiegensis TaxID=1429043 RepID=A0A0D2GBN1_9BACT|nr:methyltransferase domain-containing protein [Dethiosulfatarculus sandiegensis]KIX12302.1 hypothetical protein X474_20225 [Dethiosulfatarculus sandiegensis]
MSTKEAHPLPTDARRRIYLSMQEKDVFWDLRKNYLELVFETRATHAEHLKKTGEWLYYVFACRLLSQFIGFKNATIIDWGGFYGQVTAILTRLGARRTNNYLLEKPAHYDLFVKKIKIPTIYGQKPNALNLPDNFCEVFISSGVLEHVHEDGEGDEDLILWEINRVLKPGGWFILWNLPSLLSCSELLAASLRKPHHDRRFWDRAVFRRLKGHGFSIQYIDKHKLLPGSLISHLGKIINPLLLARADDVLAHLWPLSALARDYFIMARKT